MRRLSIAGRRSQTPTFRRRPPPGSSASGKKTASQPGLIIGRANMPIVNEGDALFHIAKVSAPEEAEDRIESLNAQLDGAAMFDEDEII